jgi:hypothetical protein
MLNICGIVVAILKMVIGRTFLMLGINLGHHYLPTSPLEEQFCVFKIFEMSAIFKMAAKTRHKKWAVKIQHCPISSKFDMSFMKFCPVVPEICRVQVHGPRKKERKRRIIIIIIRNGAKTISLHTLLGRLFNMKRGSLKMYFGQHFHTPMKLQKNTFNS